MTVAEHHPPPAHPSVTVERFEPVAPAAEREAVELAFINGRIRAEGVTGGDRNGILTRLFRPFVAHRPDLDLMRGQGLGIDTYRDGRARPDGVLAPVGYFDGQGEWAAPDNVLAVVFEARPRRQGRDPRHRDRPGLRRAEEPVRPLRRPATRRRPALTPVR